VGLVGSPCAERRTGPSDHWSSFRRRCVGLAACFVPRLVPTTTVLGEPASPPSHGPERCCELVL